MENKFFPFFFDICTKFALFSNDELKSIILLYLDILRRDKKGNSISQPNYTDSRFLTKRSSPFFLVSKYLQARKNEKLHRLNKRRIIDYQDFKGKTS